MKTVTPLQTVTPVGPTTPRSGGRTQATELPRSGQIFKATVLEARPDSRFLLGFGDSHLLARSDAALKPGQVLQLQVLSTTPQIELKIVSDTLNQFIGKSITLIGKNIDISSLYQSLTNTSPPVLDSLSLTSRQTLENFFALQHTPLSGDEGGTILKQLIDRLGLSLEHMLARGDTTKAPATLKAALLELQHGFKNAENIAENTSRILATLELFQLAQLHVESGRQFIFPLPLPFIEQGYLMIDRDQEHDTTENSSGEQELRFSLHLTMKDIGNLRIDFFHSAEGLFIRFHADSAEKADFVFQYSQELKDAISGVPLLGLSFAGDAEDPVGNLVRSLVPEGTSMLNTKV